MMHLDHHPILVIFLPQKIPVQLTLEFTVMCFFNDNFFNFQQFFSPIGYGPLFQIVHVASNTDVDAGMYLCFNPSSFKNPAKFHCYLFDFF